MSKCLASPKSSPDKLGFLHSRQIELLKTEANILKIRNWTWLEGKKSKIVFRQDFGFVNPWNSLEANRQENC